MAGHPHRLRCHGAYLRGNVHTQDPQRARGAAVRVPLPLGPISAVGRGYFAALMEAVFSLPLGGLPRLPLIVTETPTAPASSLILAMVSCLRFSALAPSSSCAQAMTCDKSLSANARTISCVMAPPLRKSLSVPHVAYPGVSGRLRRPPLPARSASFAPQSSRAAGQGSCPGCAPHPCRTSGE